MKKYFSKNSGTEFKKFSLRGIQYPIAHGNFGKVHKALPKISITCVARLAPHGNEHVVVKLTLDVNNLTNVTTNITHDFVSLR